MRSRRLRRAAGLGTTFMLLTLAAGSGRAAGAERPDLGSGWPEGWRRIGTAESASVAGLAGSAVALLLFLKAPDQPRWDSAILFDDSARNALRTSVADARSRAGTISNGALVLAAYPMVVDAVFLTWLGKGQADAALQLVLIDLEAVTITAIVTTTMQRTIGRARPFLRECSSANPIRRAAALPTAATPRSSAAMPPRPSRPPPPCASSTRASRSTAAPTGSCARLRSGSPRAPACSGSSRTGIGQPTWPLEP